MSPSLRPRDQWEALRRQIGNVPTRAPDHLFTQLQRGNAEQRWQAAVALVAIADPLSVWPLIAALNDSDVRVVGLAALGLGVFGGRQAITPLMAAFRRAQTPDLRKVILHCLAEIGAPAVPELIRLLCEGHSDVWDHLALSLAEVGQPAAQPLIDAMCSFEAFDQRSIVATSALGEIGAPARPVIVAALRDPRLPEHVREWLEVILDRMGG